MLKIRVFMASDDVEICEKFVIGHQKVLSEIGVKVTSGGNEWINDPFVCVMAVLDTETNEVVGGARVHIAHRGADLPMVEAISRVDLRIYDEIDALIDNGVAEICGLWNARSIAGLGIGSNLLVRICIAITEQLKVDKLVGLVAKHTFKRVMQKGFKVMDTVGNNGQFKYPKLDLIATSVILENPVDLPLALDEEREQIKKIRMNRNGEILQKWAKGQFTVGYEMNLPSSIAKVK